jgi:hypothetical protein
MFDLLLSWAVVILPTAFALVIEVVSKEMKERPYWRVGVIAFGIGLSSLTWFQMSRATKEANADREKAIVETSEKVSSKVSASVSESVSKSVTKAVSDQYTGTINSLQLQIGSLQGQIALQGKNVEAIKSSNLVTGKQPVKIEVANPEALSKPNVSVSAMTVASDPRYGKNAMQFILTTDRVMSGGRAVISCKNKINQGVAQVLGTGGIATTGQGGLLSDHEYRADIVLPNWSPDSPFVVTLYFDEDTLGPCSVKPLW